MGENQLDERPWSAPSSLARWGGMEHTQALFNIMILIETPMHSGWISGKPTLLAFLYLLHFVSYSLRYIRDK